MRQSGGVNHAAVPVTSSSTLSPSRSSSGAGAASRWHPRSLRQRLGYLFVASRGVRRLIWAGARDPRLSIRRRSGVERPAGVRWAGRRRAGHRQKIISVRRKKTRLWSERRLNSCMRAFMDAISARRMDNVELLRRNYGESLSDKIVNEVNSSSRGQSALRVT